MGTLDKIIELLDINNRQQKELTDYLELEKSTFSAWKSGKSASYKKYLPEIAKFFSISVDELVGTTNTNEEPLPEELVILNRNARKMSPEKRKQLLDMARLMFKEDFDE